MEKGENRKLFLNIKATLDANADISNIDISPDDNYYSMSCDFYNGNKLAFGIKKVDGVAFAKASVQSGDMPDSKLVEICDKLCDDYMHIRYSIQSGKIIFQMVIPVQKDTFEENDNMVFNELKLFVEAITECCNILGLGNIICLEKKQYVKRKSGDAMQISPNTNIEYEDTVRQEINAKENINYNNVNQADDDFNSSNIQQTIKVDDFDIEPEEFSETIHSQVNVEDIEDSFYFSGSMPVEMMDDGYNDDYDDTDDKISIIKSDDIPETDKEESISADIEESIQEMNISDNTGFNEAALSGKNTYNNTKNNNQSPSRISRNNKQDTNASEQVNCPQKPDIKKQDKNMADTNYKNDTDIQKSNYDKRKSVERKIMGEKENNQKRENDIKSERNKTMQPIGRNFSERGKNIDRNENKNRGRMSIFLRYEQDIKNLDNKYRDIIKKMELDELLKVIESHYADCTDNNGNVVHVEEHTKEALCNLAKDELKNRIAK